jgi:hypothetical protein
MNQAPQIQPGPGSYVLPSSTNGELNDYLLDRFLQQVVVGVTGMQGQYVRPRWQQEPPNQPDREISWAAIGQVNRARDAFADVHHWTSANDFQKANDRVVRNQIFEILCSFYGPEAEANSELLAMGFALEQNRNQMSANGFKLLSVADSLKVPALIKEEWIIGIDVRFRLRRQQIYTYPSPNLLAVKFTINYEEGDDGYSVAPGYGQLPYGLGPFDL